jgi:hypothetical protein
MMAAAIDSHLPLGPPHFSQSLHVVQEGIHEPATPPTASLEVVVIAVAVGQSGDGADLTFRPYIQPGDNGPFRAKDQMVVTWQTNEAMPSPGSYAVQFGRSLSELASAPVTGRVVDN